MSQSLSSFVFQPRLPLALSHLCLFLELGGRGWLVLGTGRDRLGPGGASGTVSAALLPIRASAGVEAKFF